MEEYLTVENIKIALIIISIIIVFVAECKRRGFKKALVGLMQTIEKTKVSQETPEKTKSAIDISNEIRSDWNKDSENPVIKKTGKFIDKIYDDKIKNVTNWINDYHAERDTEKILKD